MASQPYFTNYTYLHLLIVQKLSVVFERYIDPDTLRTLCHDPLSTR